MKSYVRRSTIAILVGSIAGLSSSLFLFLLDAVTNYRENNARIILILPMAGFTIGLIYHFFGENLGIRPVLRAGQNGVSNISWKTAPFVLLGTLITHLFGGSAGREGTAVQMSAGLSDFTLGKILQLNTEERKTIIQAGIGAGFGSAIGAPIAGCFFALEIYRFKNINKIWECFLAAVFANQVTIWLQAPHSYFPKLPSTWLGWRFLLPLFLLAITAGLITRSFLWITETLEESLKSIVLPIRTMLGGFILVIGFFIFGTRYMGLGINHIQEAFLIPSPLFDPFIKTIFTSITIATGFKGGEFIPLIFVGTTLGSALSIWFPASLPVLPVIGFPVIFSAASKTPIACTIMSMEIFGPTIGLYALPVCLLSTFVSGKRTTYFIEK